MSFTLFRGGKKTAAVSATKANSWCLPRNQLNPTMSYPERVQDEVRHLLPGEAGAGGGEPDASTERFFSVRWMLERERAREESDDCSSAFAIIPVGELNPTYFVVPLSAFDALCKDLLGVTASTSKSVIFDEGAEERPFSRLCRFSM